MKRKWGSTPKSEERLAEIQRHYKYECKYCGWLTIIYPFEKKSKKVCRNCGHYVYNNKQSEFKDKIKEVMK